MEGTEPEQRDAEDQVRTALDAIQGAVLRLLQEGETHPQLAVLAVAMAAGQLAAATALASGQNLEEALRELAKIMVQAGRDHHDMLRAELLLVAGNA
jgi:hypothetical protein